MRRWTAGVLVALALAGCAPMASAPLAEGDRICRWVRESVRSGAMAEHQAHSWYAHCGPFEAPSGGHRDA